MSKAVCTECRYIYDSRNGCEEMSIAPGTHFAQVSEDLFQCPHCSGEKDGFIEINDEVVEIDDLDHLTDIEAEHLPIIREEDEYIIVRIGYPWFDHPQELGHCIEWIRVFDYDGELLEERYFSPNEEVVWYFSLDREDVGSVHVSCSEHGIWKWVWYEDINL